MKPMHSTRKLDPWRYTILLLAVRELIIAKMINGTKNGSGISSGQGRLRQKLSMALRPVSRVGGSKQIALALYRKLFIMIPD